MKSLCYVLAINVVLSAADTLDARNSSNESQVQSRKVKHTISRIFSIPNNQARTAQQQNNDGYYNQLMKILTGESVVESKMGASETNTEMIDADTLLKDTKSAKVVYPESDLQDETRKELKDNLSTFHLQTDSAIGNIAGTKETELNADTLNEIIQNLKASNVSNLGHKQIRKGKLVIYYDENEGSSENPINENADIAELNIENILRIEEEIHNLFTQHKVPENIYYAIKRRADVDAKDRIKNLISAFVKFITYKGQLNSDIINKVKIFIADNDIDVDIVKLLMTTDSIGLYDFVTESPTDAVSDVMKSMLDYSGVVKTEKSVQKADVTTSLESSVINGLEHDEGNALPTVVNLPINPEISVIPTITSKSLKTLRDIVIYPQDIATTKEVISKSLIPSEVYKNVNEDSMDSSTTFNDNVHELPRRSDDMLRTVLKNKGLNLAISGQNQLKAVKTGVQDAKANMVSSGGILNQIRSQLNHGIKTKFDFETLKNILNGAIRNPLLQQVDPNVPVFSNIPVEEYLSYNNGKPFLIYVVFPESEKPKISDSEHETPNPTENDNFNSVPEDIYTIISNFLEKAKSNHESSGEYDLNSILHLIKDEIAKQKKEQDIKETNPDKPSPDVVLDTISKIENSSKSYHRNETHSENSEKELIEEIMNNLYGTKESKNELKAEDHNILDIFERITQKPITDPKNERPRPKNEIDIIKELLILFPNITIKPGYNSARNGNEKDIIEKFKEFLLNPKHSSNRPDDENARSVAEDANSLKKILQRILNGKNSANEIGMTSEQERIYQLTEELIARMKYLQRELEKRNIPKQTQRSLIEKEVQKEILKITTDSIASCVKRANKSIQLSIQKVLRKSLE